MDNVLIKEHSCGSKDGPLVEVLLNRPRSRNALDKDLIQNLTSTFGEYQKKPCRLLILGSTSDHFCAGADLDWMKRSQSLTLQENEAEAMMLHQLFLSLYLVPCPVIGVLEGSIFGGAVGLASACDHLVAHTSSTFSLSEVKLGLVPSVIMPFLQKKLSGSFLSQRVLSGMPWKGDEGFRLGFLHDLFSTPQQKTSCLQHVLQNYLSCAPEAQREAKKLIQTLSPLFPHESPLTTTELIAKRRQSAEGQEGLSAFFAKKPPSWHVDSFDASQLFTPSGR